MKYTINKILLAKVKELEYKCLCNRTKMCPCDEFLDDDKCECGVYK